MPPTTTHSPRRFHPAQVALHWLSAAGVLAALAGGTFVLKALPNTAAKIAPLQAHVVIALAATLAIALGVVLRRKMPRPPRRAARSRRLDRLAVAVHWGLPVAVLAMAGSGVALSIQAGLPAVLFGGAPAPLPADLWIYAPRLVHAVIAKALLGLVGLHVAGALFHHFVKKDGLLAGMWFGRRSGARDPE